jgi:glutathione S-transferase
VIKRLSDCVTKRAFFSLEIEKRKMVMLNVYGDAKSTCTQRVVILLEELELKYKFNSVELKNGEHKDKEFLKKQPFGKVPVVEYGDKTLFESRTILKYISKNNRDILDLVKNVYVDMWLEVEGQNFHPYISAIVLEKVFKKEKSEEVEVALKNLEEVLDVYNEVLRDREYIAGEDYSIADISHIPYAYYFLKAGYKDVLKKRENVYNWLKRIMRRPAVRRVLDGTFLEDLNGGTEEVESEDVEN